MAARHTERKKRSKKGGIITVNMKGVEGRVRMAEGEHLLKVVECSLEEGQSAEYIKWKLESSEGGIVFNNTSLATQSLWALRSWLESLGQDVPDDDMDIDPEDMVGLELMATVELDTHEGKKNPKIVDHWPVEESTTKKSKKSSRKDDDQDEKPARSKRRAADDDQPDDDAEDEKPTRGRKSKKSSKKEEETLEQDQVQDMSEDELVELIAEHDLDLDLDEFTSLRKKKAAVIDALMDAGVIKE